MDAHKLEIEASTMKLKRLMKYNTESIFFLNESISTAKCILEESKTRLTAFIMELERAKINVRTLSMEDQLCFLVPKFRKLLFRLSKTHREISGFEFEFACSTHEYVRIESENLRIRRENIRIKCAIESIECEIKIAKRANSSYNVL